MSLLKAGYTPIENAEKLEFRSQSQSVALALNETIWLLIIVFVLSGVCMPLLIMIINENGGAEASTFLIALPGSLGPCLGVFLSPVEQEIGKVEWGIVFGLVFLEVFSQAFILDGLMLAGSAIYTVAYSSVVVYTAILSIYLVNRHLTAPQWLGVLMVMVGLGLVSLDAKSNGRDVLLGFFFVLLGSLSHSLNYVGCEYVLTKSNDPIRPEYLAFILGSMGTSVNIVWQMIHTLPNAKTLIIDNITTHHGSVKVICIAYFLLFIASVIHAYTFFNLLAKIGSTTTGLLKGVQSVLVFIASHYLFCDVQQSQCFSLAKGISFIVVLSGVTIYSLCGFPHSPEPSTEFTAIQELDDLANSSRLSPQPYQGLTEIFEP